MADCVLTTVMEADVMQAACSVHCHFAPCPHDGKPAVSLPMHCDEYPSRAEAIAYALKATGGHRTIVAHRGTWADKHDDVDGTTCVCGPEVFAPQQGDQ